MSNPEDQTDPETTEQPGSTGAPETTELSGSTEPTEPPGSTETTELSGSTEPPGAPWWHQPPPGPSGWGTAGYPQAGPQGGSLPSGQHGPYGWDPGSPGVPGAGGGWQGGQWSGGPWGWGHQVGGWGPQVPAQGPGGPGRRRGSWTVVAVCLTVLALLIGVGIGYGVWSGGSATPTAGRSFVPSNGTPRSTSTYTRTPVQTTGSTGRISSATGSPSDVSSIAAKVTPGLVDIDTVLGYQTEEAAGTGMVLTSTGKVLTNNHVIEESTKITATDLGNGQTYSASVLGYTHTQDVAVIQLADAHGLTTVHLGSSASVKVGEAVVGIGNAGGVGGTPSAAGGSVTALDQAITASDEGAFGTTVEHLTGLIESNADIQPGDSGGPLVTTSGSVVGMDTAAAADQGYTFSGAATGRGYSIPIDRAISLAHEIIAGESSASLHIGKTAFLGVYVETVGRTPTSTFGISPTPTGGVVVTEVIPNTPAESSGLERSDVITSVGGTKVTNVSGLMDAMLEYHPGDVVKVVWTTATGQTQSATITLGNGPPD